MGIYKELYFLKKKIEEIQSLEDRVGTEKVEVA